MALGKRKSRQDENTGVSELDAAEIFRRHFEAEFAPLDEDKDAAHRRALQELDEDDEVDSDFNGDGDDDDDEDDSDTEEDDEWGGVSGDDDDDEDDIDEDEVPVVEVIDHSKPQAPKEPKMSKKELKAFMSSKVIDHTTPKTTTPESSSSSKPAKALPEDAPSLLAQDLELRRLLSESHLLTPKHNNAASSSVFASSVVHGAAAEPKAFASGKTRQRATDLRLQALGSKGSALQQERMPMHMRKGIVAAAGAREAKRRREAKENGVILERSAQGKAGKKGAARGRKERGVDGPGIGRFKGAELRISEADVRKIEGSRDTFGRRGRR